MRRFNRGAFLAVVLAGCDGAIATVTPSQDAGDDRTITGSGASSLSTSASAASSGTSTSTRASLASSGTSTSTRATQTAITSSSPGSSSTATASSSTPTTASNACGVDAGVCVCPLPDPLPPNGLLYAGGTPAPNCPGDIAYGPPNYWFGYYDSAVTTDAATFVHVPDFGGCGGPSACAMHTSGAGLPNFAGVGFPLNDNLPFDASGFTGLEVWMRGTTTGTRGPSYVASDNTVGVKFMTGPADGGIDPRLGDDFKGYCPLPDCGSCFALCRLPFVGLVRDGYKSIDAGVPDPATDTFDPQNLTKIEFDFGAYSSSASQTGTVTFDVWIGEVAFYTQ